uniref:Uncharacterized protein n=1 Tax=Grammatophora oceanica TaxID=210454 RepID=A0A6U5IRZ3_9STRA|mmetsp:Transcript_22569/g.33494  ORF Transcript_22569/g.33494 Transcript_22569/m.33494 type:complete len:336 (+) Transcript_22569:410-1417(+)
MELGKEGATVYVTGTSSRADESRGNKGGRFGLGSKKIQGKYLTNEDVGGPGTVDDTADEVTAAGGLGIPVLCNHADDEQVKQLFEQVEEEQGRLDILINNVFRVPPGGADSLSGKFWTLGMELFDVLHDVGVRSHYASTVFAMPLMLRSRKTSTKLDRPFIGMISSFGGNSYTFNVPYGVAKGAVDRMAKDMAIELNNEDVCVLSFYPGLVMTERTERMVESGEWERDVGLPVENAESPRFTGRAVVAVATDPNNMEKSGTFQVVAELADEYGFTDVDGKKPPSIRSLKFLLPSYAFDEETRKKIPDWMIPDWKLPFSVMAQGRPPDKDDEPRSI